MRLTSITLSNYKSFLDEGRVEIGAGFNLFIGANNSGKTTMLEALDLTGDKTMLHRSIWSMPEFNDQAQGRSSLKISIESTLQELCGLVGTTVYIPIPRDYRDKLLHDGNPVPQTAAFEKIQAQPLLAIHLDYGGGLEYMAVESALGVSSMAQNEANHHILQLQYPDRQFKLPQCNIANLSGSSQLLNFGNIFRQFFYRFSAQRNPATQCGFTASPAVLLPDASNLAFCLSQLQLHDAYGHSLLCDWVHRVFPSVRWVQAPAVSNNQWHIQCLPRSPQERRNDLAVTLDQMGTGIGNVIAIFFIVLTSRRARVIAIDEPNSFLHPRALRELLQILAVEGSQHQYILTAHSPDVLTAVDPSIVTMFSAPEGRTAIRQVAGIDIAELRTELSDLGIRMTDLHGRDRVLWVEGQTEELVLPELLRKFCPHMAAGTAVLRVEHTGTFEKKGVAVSEVAKLYTRLSQSSALVPPMVAILLDRESRKESDCQRLIQECNGTLQLLDRPMLEDYVLSAAAIAARLNQLDESCDEVQVQHLLDKKNPAETAAKTLTRIFTVISEARHQFHKTRDVPALITWLLKQDPDFLDPLGSCLATIFHPVESSV